MAVLFCRRKGRTQVAVSGLEGCKEQEAWEQVQGVGASEGVWE